MRCAAGAWLCWPWQFEPQHPAASGGPHAGASLAPAVGKPKCSSIARTPLPAFTYANTLKPASTPRAGQHLEVQRPLQQPCPIHSRPPLLHPLLPRRCLTPPSPLLCLEDQKWPQFGAWSKDAVEPREATLAAHPREAVRQHSAFQVLGLRPAPRTGAGRALPRWLPPAMWPSSPAPPRTAPSPPAAFAGTPTRAFPPAPPQPHLARAHATVHLPQAPWSPWLLVGIGAYESKLQQPRAEGGRFDSRRFKAAIETPSPPGATPWGRLAQR
jgi:hypothetical protein